jgi:glycosyltransferase involved in cell wall biosynthesis
MQLQPTNSADIRRGGGSVKRKLRILYVCPFAHHAGHYSYAALSESSALAKEGAEILVVTFRGFLGGEGVQGIPCEKAVGEGSFLSLALTRMASYAGPRSRVRVLVLLAEMIATLIVALKLRRKQNFELIYLRDGDPFIFVPHLLGALSRGGRWVVSLAGNWSIFRFQYRLVSSRFWKPVYRSALSRNQFIYLCQSNTVRRHYEEFLGGVLRGKVRELPLWVNDSPGANVSSLEARVRLGLPTDRPMLLHFGALHWGKDFRTVLLAVRKLPTVSLVHAGDVMPSNRAVTSSAQWSAANLDSERVIMRTYYVPEPEKVLYFRAADAIILSYRSAFSQVPSNLWEAARFGVPVIAGDNGELGKLVQRYRVGILYKSEDSESLKDAIVRFLDLSQEQRAALGRNWATFCADFSLGNWARSFLATAGSLHA